MPGIGAAEPRVAEQLTQKDVVSPSALTVSHFLAKGMVQTGKQKKEVVEELSQSIAEIEMQTQIKGASFLKVHMVDPQWSIANSGLINRKPDGLLPDIEVEFPAKTNFWWHLCACELTNDYAMPNLILTFEDRIVHELREEFGEGPRAPAGVNSRAEFVRKLVGEVALHGQPAIRTRIPLAEGLQEQRARESSERLERGATRAVQTQTEAAEAVARKAAGKEQDTGKLTPAQYEFAALVAFYTGLSPKVVCAWCLQEESSSAATGRENAQNFNWLNIGFFDSGPGQITQNQVFKNNYNSAIYTAKFIKGEWGGASSGIQAILKSAGKEDSQQITAIQTSGWASSGYPSFPQIYAEITTAQTPTPTNAAGAQSKQHPGKSERPGVGKHGEIARGTTQNPSENSWECIQRIANEVNYFAFTNGTTLYYMDGLELAKARPTAFVDARPSVNKLKKALNGRMISENSVIQIPLTSTFDNTTLEYLASRKLKGRTQKRSRVSKPQTPSEIRVNIVSEITDYRAGEVVFFENSGPLNGRWIITDSTRLCIKDHHTQLILEPPLAPIPETVEGQPITSVAATAPATTETLPYVNPFAKAKGLVASRVDQGVDYTMEGGSEITALGAGEMKGEVGGWPGGPLIFYELQAGAYKGKFVYVAEGISPQVRSGQKVNAGQLIATYNPPGGPGIETGWATSNGEPLAKSTGGYTEGARTAAGQSFSNFLQALGAPPGTTSGRPITGNLPPGYPS